MAEKPKTLKKEKRYPAQKEVEQPQTKKSERPPEAKTYEDLQEQFKEDTGQLPPKIMPTWRTPQLKRRKEKKKIVMHKEG